MSPSAYCSATRAQINLLPSPFTRDDLYDPDDRNADRVLFVDSWVEMITVLNEMARGLGQSDF